jgi:hypothetical protein
VLSEKWVAPLIDLPGADNANYSLGCLVGLNLRRKHCNHSTFTSNEQNQQTGGIARSCRSVGRPPAACRSRLYDRRSGRAEHDGRGGGYRELRQHSCGRDRFLHLSDHWRNLLWRTSDPGRRVGGAGGGGQYDVVGLGNTVSQTLTFASGKTYFGLWWSAGDAANTLTFYQGASVLGSYVIGDIIPSLSSAYLGNPNGGGNPGEYYAYLNFTTTDGDLIDRIVFGNVTSSGFESDNHSVYDQPIEPPGHTLPDGGSTLILALGSIGLLASLRRMVKQ